MLPKEGLKEIKMLDNNKEETHRLRDVATEDGQIDNFADWLIKLGNHLKENHPSFRSASVDYQPKGNFMRYYLSYVNACKLIITIEKGVG